ncbi:hypothetical protein GCM10027614_74890 [Micromonospora vulcania]
MISSGHHRYFTRRGGELVSSVYPFVAEPVAPFEIESVEFLQPRHPIYALRPANPLTIGFGYYSPRSSFAYPGGLSVHQGSGQDDTREPPWSAHQVPDNLARSGLPSGS